MSAAKRQRLYEEHLERFRVYLELRALETPLRPARNWLFSDRVRSLWCDYAELGGLPFTDEDIDFLARRFSFGKRSRLSPGEAKVLAPPWQLL